VVPPQPCRSRKSLIKKNQHLSAIKIDYCEKLPIVGQNSLEKLKTLEKGSFERFLGIRNPSNAQQIAPILFLSGCKMVSLLQS
jgi:hypothetical protein